MANTVYILNGPNLNLLGTREPEIYGSTTLADIEAMCQKHAEKNGLSLSFHQSNDEGALVELIQEARSKGSAIIINAGAYTHTSVAILDAILALEIPVIEVHLSNLFKREAFRHHSYITPAAQGLICGLGAQGYVMALDYLSQS
ncbi:3-dehydroquinate dehydratase [alpha proteobacterium IMCC14465]|uniref:3-dehydroquinate dehydratase n=1 Tax=alpha proteobacterium IMCC14465 TaxID=1220535 RepID=J9DIU4_9PROT|nr:3-dehydroquinate dehydratase [alpha proteobacterium IMCC14465]